MSMENKLVRREGMTKEGKEHGKVPSRIWSLRMSERQEFRYQRDLTGKIGGGDQRVGW